MPRRKKNDQGCLVIILAIGLFLMAGNNPELAATILIVAVSVWVARVAWRKHKEEEARAEFAALAPFDLDIVSGREFEWWVVCVLERDGIKAENLPHSGDFGVDVIAVVNGVRVGIQAKRYSNKVSNRAVQEAVSGADYHGCEVAAVVTQSYFTRAAIEQAKRSRLPVLLYQRNDLPKLSQHLRNDIGGR